MAAMSYEQALKHYAYTDYDDLRDMTHLLDPKKDREELKAIYELMQTAERGPTTMRQRFGTGYNY